MFSVYPALIIMFQVGFNATNLKRLGFRINYDYYVFTYGPWKHLKSRYANQFIYNVFGDGNYLGNNNSYRYGFYIRCSALQQLRNQVIEDGAEITLPSRTITCANISRSSLITNGYSTTTADTNGNYFYKPQGADDLIPYPVSSGGSLMILVSGTPTDKLEYPQANQSDISKIPDSIYNQLENPLAREIIFNDSKIYTSCMNCMAYYDPDSTTVSKPYIFHDSSTIINENRKEYNPNAEIVSFDDGTTHPVKGCVLAGQSDVNLFDMDIWNKLVENIPNKYFGFGTLPIGFTVFNQRRRISVATNYSYITELFVTIENPE